MRLFRIRRTVTYRIIRLKSRKTVTEVQMQQTLGSLWNRKGYIYIYIERKRLWNGECSIPHRGGNQISLCESLSKRGAVVGSFLLRPETDQNHSTGAALVKCCSNDRHRGKLENPRSLSDQKGELVGDDHRTPHPNDRT